MIYFDNNSTTKIAKEVSEKMSELYKFPLNSSATHKFGQLANQEAEEARREIKSLLNAENYDVIFTSSATEANNLAIFGCGLNKIFSSKIEHASVVNCAPNYASISEISANENGILNIKDFENISEKNFLACAMLANNETGAIQPVEEIAKIIHQKGGLIHSDIVQAVGKIDVDLEKLNVDFASLSAHKIYGAQGAAALLVRKGIDVNPIIFGSRQEKSKRSGTLNIAAIAGFGVACKIAKSNIEKYREVKILRDYLETEIKKIAKDDVKIFSKDAERLPNTSYFALRNADNQTLVIYFDLNDVAISAGSACSSGAIRESRVLKAMNAEKDFLSSAIRISLGVENTKSEIDEFLRIFAQKFKS